MVIGAPDLNSASHAGVKLFHSPYSSKPVITPQTHSTGAAIL